MSSEARKGLTKIMTHVSVLLELDRLSVNAELLWHRARLYCARAGNDGRLPKRELSVALGRKLPRAKAEAAASELIEYGLWAVRGDTYELVGWLDEQPSAEDWNDPLGQMRLARNRALHKDQPLIQRIRARDGNQCRYCGRWVNWKDRKGAGGATYDHIDPNDPDNALDKVVVACRECNGRKGARTPEQWLAEQPRQAHALRPPPPPRATLGSGSDLDPEQIGSRSGVGFPSRACATAQRTGSDLDPIQIPNRPGPEPSEPAP